MIAPFEKNFFSLRFGFLAFSPKITLIFLYYTTFATQNQLNALAPCQILVKFSQKP